MIDESYNDAKQFYRDLQARLGKFKLQLSVEKSLLLIFTRFRTETSNRFTFWGLEYYWSQSRTGKTLVKMQTSKKKLLAAIRSFQS